MQMLIASLLAVVAAAAPTTGQATNVTATSATLTGTVDAAGSYFFEYGTDTGYGLTTKPEAAPGPGPVEADVSGLTAETTYHYRIVSGGQPGADRTFTTAANPKPPAISNQRARDIAPTTATATASINPNGSATTYRIEYGTTTRYGSETEPARTGTAATTVSVALNGLRPYTRYHWRTVATNAAGTTRGADRSFRTARLPSGVTLGLSRRTVPWGGDVRLGGRVSGAGVAGMTVALEQQRLLIDQDFTALDTARTGRDGGYLFTIPRLWTTTSYRVRTQTQVVATSPAVTARSRVRVGIRARHLTRKRARIEGSMLPASGGTATLQLRRPGRGWRSVRTVSLVAGPTASRYAIGVRRVKRVARRFRVVATPATETHVRGWSRAVAVKAQPKKRR